MDLLTINKKDASADDDKGPSVDSENVQERIEARRLRIKKKKEQSLRYLFLDEIVFHLSTWFEIVWLIFYSFYLKRGKEPPSDANKKKELTKARKQIQNSRARLVKLEKDGLELVSEHFQLLKPKKC